MSAPPGDLEAAREALERAVADAQARRKNVLDPVLKEQIGEEIWRLRRKVVGLERERAGRMLARASREASEAAASGDLARYEGAHREMARHRIAFADASDLLEKLEEEGPSSSRRLLGG
ncbi:hypothetical protein [Rubrobacter naiadicus]|uniref:hypothetical protein n=1 Tax=Rubrobacter naiadicus TaxID=1392641 RepID=UPI002360D073|nr:hypothetical protein [Rubrobacter naiadicus]